MNPGYPDPLGGGATQEILPPSRYMLGQRPGDAEAGARPRRRDAAGLAEARRSTLSYSHTNGWDRFRGRNVNAPLDGVRPDPALGNVTQVESTARLVADRSTPG